MKLKKIASLMLAGVMAVSMLAGCNTASNGGNNGGEGEGEGTTTTGYSVAFGDKVEKLNSAVKGMDYVTFADNANDQAALEDALNNAGALGILFGTMSPDVSQANAIMPAIRADFEDAAKLNRYGIDNGAALVFNATSTINRTTKVGSVYYVDGTVSMDKVLDQLAARLDALFATLQKDSVATNDNIETYDFDYTISVSVVDKALQPHKGIVAIFIIECCCAHVLCQHRTALLVYKRDEQTCQRVGFVGSCRIVDQRSPLSGCLLDSFCRCCEFLCSLRNLIYTGFLKKRSVGIHDYRMDIEWYCIQLPIHPASFERCCLEIGKHLIRHIFIKRQKHS